MMACDKTLIVIVGPTGIGKTALAIELAQHFSTEIISADSRQFFKEMEIGTAKPSAAELLAAPHHFINSNSITQLFSTGDFEIQALDLIGKLFQKHQLLIMVGGSGLYIDAVCNGLDDLPETDLQIREQLNKKLAEEGLQAIQEQLKTVDPAVVTEIDGVVTLGGVKRGNREMTIESKDGEVKKYLVPLSKHILVQDNDFVKAGMPLSDGSISPADILAIKGPAAVQEYLVNGIQEVYRLQGVKINDKHFEVIVHQMMQKVHIEDPGDTIFLENNSVDRWDFMIENDEIYDKKVVVDAGDSNTVKPGQIVSLRKLRDENSQLKRKDLKQIEVRDARPATASSVLQGITRASLGTKSFISAASFQETTKVLNEAAIAGKRDSMLGLKENVIVGHLIPSGTGVRGYERIIVGSQEEYDKLLASKQEEIEA